jgi:hypothetical protein
MDAIRTSHRNWMMAQQIATAGHLEVVLPIFEERQKQSILLCPIYNVDGGSDIASVENCGV